MSEFLLNQDLCYFLLEKVLKVKDIKDVCNDLFIHKGTIKRWMDRKIVPKNYENDLLKMLGEPINYTHYRDLDQFYTKTESAKYCYEKTLNILDKNGFDYSDYTFIEPSVGNGSFYKFLPDDKKIGIDIDANIKFDNVIVSDYLDFTPKNGKYIVIGNPPFGLRGNLALRFINHSFKFADVVAFILPPLFNSDGKGTPKKRIKGYNIIHSEDLPLNSFQYPNFKEVDVATIFQIWAKLDIEKEENNTTIKEFVKIYSLSDGGTPSSTRNKNMLYNCDAYLPSTCFSGMAAYKSFEELPHRRGYGLKILKNNENVLDLVFNRINWSKIAFLSTNSAINLRTSLIENAIYKGAMEIGIKDFV